MSHETDRKILKSAQQGYQNPLLYEYEYKWLYSDWVLRVHEYRSTDSSDTAVRYLAADRLARAICEVS
jgi:hypothetical protein